MQSLGRTSTRRRALSLAVVSSLAVLGLGLGSGSAAADGKKSDGAKEHDNEREKPEAENENHGGPELSTLLPCIGRPDGKYFIDQTKLPLTALPGARSLSGVLDGAGYQMEVPANWNGELVVWAHGFAGWGCELGVDTPPMRKYLIENGFAWVASSYSRNGYVIQQGVNDSIAAAKLFKKLVKKPKRTYMTGASMGGHITGVAIEQKKEFFDGAMPVCGVMGDHELFDYFTAYNQVAAALANVTVPFPTPTNYLTTYVPAIRAGLGASGAAKLAAATKNLSGGERPGWEVSYGFWDSFNFLFGLAVPNPGFVPAFPASNVNTVYQLDADPEISDEEQALNQSVPRVSRFDFPTLDGTVSVPEIHGTFEIPVLTMHTLGDLFVPFSMEQIYARRAAANDNREMLVQRAIRDTTHCGFAEAEYNRAFGDLVSWVRTEIRPEGDDVLDSAAVAQPTFGCRFSNNTGIFTGSPFRGAAFAPCP